MFKAAFLNQSSARGLSPIGKVILVTIFSNFPRMAQLVNSRCTEEKLVHYKKQIKHLSGNPVVRGWIIEIHEHNDERNRRYKKKRTKQNSHGRGKKGMK